MHIDRHTLLTQIRTLAAIGVNDHGERTRLALDDADKAARDRLVQWMRALDMRVCIDQVGNIFGIYPAAATDTHNALMIGSHIDTVRNAGALDGCYGVLSGLAVVRAWHTAGEIPPRPIIVAAFTNEEGVRFHPDMMGSLAMAGGIDVNTVLDAEDADGIRLGDELARIGYAGDTPVGALIPREYLELHIEQGPVLEAEGLDIGVVDSLQGISWQEITLTGAANHAGTTPIELRHDAGYGAAVCIARLREHICANGFTRATVGCLQLFPNAINVIPVKAVFTVDMRDPDDARLQDAEARLNAELDAVAAREGLQATRKVLARFAPVQFDAALAQHIEDAAVASGLRWKRMTSGAGHDAQMIARVARAAMIFVPSRGGISHSPLEHTDDAQLCHGADILLATVQRCLGKG